MQPAGFCPKGPSRRLDPIECHAVVQGCQAFKPGDFRLHCCIQEARPCQASTAMNHPMHNKLRHAQAVLAQKID